MDKLRQTFFLSYFFLFWTDSVYSSWREMSRVGDSEYRPPPFALHMNGKTSYYDVLKTIVKLPYRLLLFFVLTQLNVALVAVASPSLAGDSVPTIEWMRANSQHIIRSLVTTSSELVNGRSFSRFFMRIPPWQVAVCPKPRLHIRWRYQDPFDITIFIPSSRFIHCR